MARYIDADEALRVMRNVKSDKPSYGDWELACDCCIGMVEVVPTADVVEVAHAKWEINCDGYYPYCSNCMTEPKSGVMSKYCPECGAKMDRERKEK